MSYQDQNDIKFSSDISRFLKAVCYLCLLALVIGILFVVLGCFRISSFSFRTYESIDRIPYNKVGVLLGTSPLEAGGSPNEYFTYRIMAASQLYKAGKIDYILVSGDNRHESYNEPRLMKRALIRAGVPANRIVFDFAGISTLDSVIRARKVFLLKSATFISQDFQNERALFIADKYDLNAIGYNAINPSSGFIKKVAIREFFARIKCVFDIYILNSQPKFLGKPERIGTNSLPKELSSKPKKMTSALKLISDNAFIVRQAEKIARFEPLAKKLSDNAKIINFRQERLENEYDSSNSLVSTDDLEHSEILSEEQNDALVQATEQASESLNLGSGNTYIAPTVQDDVAVAADSETAPSAEEKQENREPQKNFKKRKKIRRKDIKTFNGDPWDYY
ncbi:MAG: vancomycin high temperature exclusion protein [Succinivibrio sp.]